MSNSAKTAVLANSCVMTHAATRVIACLLLLLCVPRGLAGQTAINGGHIEPLIDEWNAAHNMRNAQSFERLYDTEVRIHTGRISKDRAIRIKQQLFHSNPLFRQRIITEISYQRSGANMIKCSFVKEVFDGDGWKKFPSYLLVRHAGDRYLIAGEYQRPAEVLVARQEAQADDTGIGEATAKPETFDSAIALPPRVIIDSAMAAEVDTSYRELSSSHPVPDVEDLFTGMSSFGTVTVPRSYVFILIAMLAIGGLTIFVADSLRAPRRRRRVNGAVLHADAQHVVRDFRVQAAFESFVMTLFDPLFFKSSRPTIAYAYAGQAFESEKGPDLMLDYQQKDTHVRFAIICQYYQQTAKHEIQLLSLERQGMVKNFERDHGVAVYYVLGFGGRPDDPRELYFIPAGEVDTEYITRARLLRYSKSGMFYYHRRTGRIQ